MDRLVIRYAISLLFAAAAASCTSNEPAGAILPEPPPPPAPPSPPPPPPQPGDLQVTVDATQQFQTIQGFGFTQRLFSDPHLIFQGGADSSNAIQISAAAKDEIYDRLYKDLGLTRLRPVLDARGIEAANDNSDPAVTDLSKFDFSWKKSDGFFDPVRSARQRGVTTWWFSPYRLELWMTDGSAEEYAEWAMATLRHWKNAGLEFPYWSIMSEPGTDLSGQWSPAFLRDAVKALGRRIKAEGLTTKLVVPDDLNPGRGVPKLQVILADPEARSYLAAIAIHLYGIAGLYTTTPIAGMDELKALADQYGLPLWMTEFYTVQAFEWAILMQRLLTEYNFTAIDIEWGYFGGVNGSVPLIHLETSGNVYTGYTRTRWYYMMGQFSPFIRPGARRIAASSGDPAVMMSAFHNGSALAIVAINRGTTPKSIYVKLNGLSGTTSLAVMRSTEFKGGQTLDPVAVSQTVFRFDLPPGTVTTFSK